MAIEVRYFASLRERMGRAEDRLAADRAATVSAVWRQVSGDSAVPTHILCAVNMQYVDPETPVKDGDEVAFFPPVTGG